MRLMTNNPAKYAGLEGYGLSISERVPLETHPTRENIAYLRTKRDRLGHLLRGLDEVPANPLAEVVAEAVAPRPSPGVAVPPGTPGSSSGTGAPALGDAGPESLERGTGEGRR
jgi:3,4-dihydroxy 2-butanone 4-phosphate synthase / GTP cyclohydrolase II